MNILTNFRSIGRREYHYFRSSVAVIMENLLQLHRWCSLLADLVLDLDEYSNKPLEKISVVVRDNYSHLCNRTCQSNGLSVRCVCVFVCLCYCIIFNSISMMAPPRVLLRSRLRPVFRMYSSALPKNTYPNVCILVLHVLYSRIVFMYSGTAMTFWRLSNLCFKKKP